MVNQLAAWGAERVYGVVGDTLFPLMDAIDRHPGVRFIPVRHEAAAGFMASAEAKLTGRPTCCLATSGPGIANLLNGLGDAYADRVGVIAITGQVERAKIGTESKQYVDQQSFVRPLAGYTALLADPEAVGHILPTALRMAVGERLVAHLSVPKDLFAMDCGAVVVPYEPYLDTPPVPAPAVVRGALDLMASARRPLILMGQGARCAADEVVALAERWGAGIIQSLPAKGAVPWSHPLLLGGLGDGGTDATHTALPEADLLLAAGVNWWPEKYVPAALPVIKLDRSPANIGGKMAVVYGIAGDTRTVLPLLAAGVDLQARPEWRGRLTALRDAWETRLEMETADSGTLPSPQFIVRTLERVLPPDAIVALDTGDHTVWFNRIFAGERQEVLVSGTWRSLGFGLPAAMAAKLARPGRTVVALVGDTGLMSLMGELVTAAELGLHVVVVVVNNGMMAMERNRAVANGYSTLGTTPRNPDFARLAAACGLSSFMARTGRELQLALPAALAADGPVLIDVLATAPVAPTVGE
jgi:pyruvate dehydrogenase (quinone)/pyruvate oxidase